MRRLRESGIAIVYISHFLEEVQRIADRFTVLRDGRTVDSGEMAGTPTERPVMPGTNRSGRGLNDFGAKRPFMDNRARQQWVIFVWPTKMLRNYCSE